MFQSRKFVLTLVCVAVVLVIAVAAALLKKYLGVDVSEVAKWAMLTIGGLLAAGNGTIAWEDVGKEKAKAAQAQASIKAITQN